jgi:2-hydroxy-6-oxonona-2,4-dienedioate hydrolase
MARPAAPIMAVRTSGSGPDLVLFHGGMGCWQHWIHNIGPLSEHFTVQALDHPAYGASASVPRQMTGAEYLDLVHRTFLEMFPGHAPLRLAGFSFGGAIAAYLAARLGSRVTHVCLISPAGLPPRPFTGRPTRSYKDAGDDAALFREICRHNLLVNMLSYPETITDETLDIQAYCVRHTRFNSRKVSGGGTLLGDLQRLTCRLRVLWGEGDDAPYRPAAELIGQIRDVVPDLDLHRIPCAGHWSAYENAPAVNRLMIEFLNS